MTLLVPGIAVIAQPMPGLPLPTSNCYLFATDSGALVVDPGMAAPGFLENVASGLASVGRGLADVTTVVLTHYHRDHSEGAEQLRASTGAEVLIHPADRGAAASRAVTEELLVDWGVPPDRRRELLDRPLPPDVDADGTIAGGREFDTAAGTLRAVHTPGHTPGHLCFELGSHRMLLTGDHILPDQYPGAGAGGRSDENPIAVYLGSLDSMVAYAGWTGHPGHGAPVPDLEVRAGDIARHHRNRTDEVRAVVAVDPRASTWSVAERIRWGGGFEALAPGRLIAALRQTQWHRELVGGYR